MARRRTTTSKIGLERFARLDTDLNDSPAILFKGIPDLQNSQDLTLFARYLKLRLIEPGCSNYSKNMQARSMQSKTVSNYVRTASDEPPPYTVEPHHEFHTAAFPHKLMLFCESPAPKGGEFIVGDGRAIYRDLDPKVVAKFEEREVQYRVFYESLGKNNRYTNWQTNVAPTKEGVEEYMTKKGYDWSWGEDDSLTYWSNFQPVKAHPVTGEKVFFHQIHPHHKSFYTNHPYFAENPVHDNRWPVHCAYGDGTEIEPEVIRHLRETTWKHCVTVAPQSGDLLVIDNYLAVHGRMGYEGDRKVFVVAIYE